MLLAAYLDEVLTRDIINTSPAAGFSFCNLGCTFINIKCIRDHVARWG